MTESDDARSKRTRVQGEGISLDPYLNALPLDGSVPPEQMPETVDAEAESLKNARLQPTLALVRMARMVGMAMETFNKSLDHRHDDTQSGFGP